MCRYFCVCLSLLRPKYRDHIVPLRVNIPSQVFLISLERERARGEKEERFIERQEAGKKGEEMRCRENVSDLRSRGTRAQTQIRGHQTKKIRKRRRIGKEGVGWGCNKYKGPNFKALMMIK